MLATYGPQAEIRQSWTPSDKTFWIRACNQSVANHFYMKFWVLNLGQVLDVTSKFSLHLQKIYMYTRQQRNAYLTNVYFYQTQN